MFRYCGRNLIGRYYSAGTICFKIQGPDSKSIYNIPKLYDYSATEVIGIKYIINMLYYI